MTIVKTTSTMTNHTVEMGAGNPNWVDADVNGNEVFNEGRNKVLIKNTHATEIRKVIKKSQRAYVNDGGSPDKVYIIPAGATFWISCGDTRAYSSPGEGLCYFEYTDPLDAPLVGSTDLKIGSYQSNGANYN